MSLSSNSVIHFTNNKEALVGILQKNFKITYCNEQILLADSVVKIQVPMVSFCDIPLSKIKDHIDKYGNYGIGLTKNWAKKKGLNPVLYIEKDSYLSDSLRSALYNALINSKNNNFSEKEKQAIDILRYTKNYQSDLKRKDSLIKDYRFSDEREWRYVPHYEKECIFILPNYKDETRKEDLDVADLSVRDLVLDFEPNDIKYIIINSEDEIPEFISILRNAKGQKFSYQDVERLTTRFITVEQIKTDF